MLYLLSYGVSRQIQNFNPYKLLSLQLNLPLFFLHVDFFQHAVDKKESTVDSYEKKNYIYIYIIKKGGSILGTAQNTTKTNFRGLSLIFG